MHSLCQSIRFIEALIFKRFIDAWPEFVRKTDFRQGAGVGFPIRGVPAFVSRRRHEMCQLVQLGAHHA